MVTGDGPGLSPGPSALRNRVQFAPSLGANCTRLSPDETRSEHSNHPLGLISDLQMSEPDDVQVVHQRDLIPFAVAFECCDPGMESPTVELDDQARLGIPAVDPSLLLG